MVYELFFIILRTHLHGCILGPG